MGEYTKQLKSGSERKNFLQNQVKQSKRRNAVPKLIPRAIAQEFEQKTGYSSANICVKESDMPDLFGAKAATQGNEIHFPRGRYQPETAEGRRILKHEMRHTIQQTRNEVAANVDGVVNNDKRKESEADKGFEGLTSSNKNIRSSVFTKIDNVPIQCCGGDETGIENQIFSEQEIDDELSSLDSSPKKIDHIINGSRSSNHHWEYFGENMSWESIKSIIKQVMMNGTTKRYKKAGQMKEYVIGVDKVQVTYTIHEGRLRISDAWVIERTRGDAAVE